MNSQKSQNFKWLNEYVFPLWATVGVHPEGGFYENIFFNGQASDGPRRAMVQCRQIYSVLSGARLGALDLNKAQQLATSSARFLIETYQQTNGSIALSLKTKNPIVLDLSAELYTQAFAIFGLAQAYSVDQNPTFKVAAIRVLNYLNSERKNPHGGWTEVKSGEISYASNPHMHLFEAALAWVAVDRDPLWKSFAHEICDLALKKFIDPDKGILGEYFTEKWEPLLHTNGHYIYEPGHQYEWSWLFKLSDELLGTETYAVRHRLFNLAEMYGTHPASKIVFDELWSDFSVKKSSSRFWPHCERIKAAVRLGSEVTHASAYAKAADDAMLKLNAYFATPRLGMWYDALDEYGSFSGDFSKSSSLYHIINAIEEYSIYREQLKT